MQQIVRAKSVGNLPLLPYSSMFANCFLWSSYGLLKREVRIWATNGIGIAFALYYFFTFSCHSPPKSPTIPGSIQQHVRANAVVVAATFASIYLSPISDPASWIGNIAVLFCVAMFGSPLAALRTVLQTKSAKSIPLPFTLATVLNCFLWSVFGVMELNDKNVFVPNLLGLGLGLWQVILKIIYGDGTGTAKSEDKMNLIA